MSFIKNNLACALCFSGVFFTACAERIVVRTQEVYIPTKCEQNIPKRPTKKENISRNVIDILEYTEKLEKIVEACVSDPSSNSSKK